MGGNRERERKRKEEKKIGGFQKGKIERRKMGEMWMLWKIDGRQKRSESETKMADFFWPRIFFAVEAFVEQQTLPNK